MENPVAILKDLLPLMAKLQATVAESTHRQTVLTGVFVAFARSVIESHPDPDEFRSAWDRQISGFWSGAGLADTPQKEFGQSVQTMIEAVLPGRTG
jgi:hypothetical protein